MYVRARRRSGWSDEIERAPAPDVPNSESTTFRYARVSPAFSVMFFAFGVDDGMNETVTCVAVVPGFVTVTSETKRVLLSPPAFTIPGIVQTDWAEAGCASSRTTAARDPEARRLTRIRSSRPATREPALDRDAQTEAFPCKIS